MTVTSAEANKMLENLNKELVLVLEVERKAKTFVACMGENIESVRPKYDFSETQKRIAELESEIRKIKHSINIFNISTLVPGFDMTIDEMLVYLPQLNSEIKKYGEMSMKLPKERKIGYQTNIVDYEYVNYDVDKARELYMNKCEELKKAHNSLDLVNSTVSFDIL